MVYRDSHLQLQRDQRGVYYDNKMKACAFPKRYLSIIVDAMDQGKTQLPVVQRRHKNDDITFIKQKLMAVKVCAIVAVRVYIF